MGCQDFHDIKITMKKQTFPILICGIVFWALLLSGAEPSVSVPAAGSTPSMVALFRTSSLVPSLPYAAYQSCDRLLSEAIMKHGCRVRGLEESAAALQKCGVVKVEDLSAEQAAAIDDDMIASCSMKEFYLSFDMEKTEDFSAFLLKNVSAYHYEQSKYYKTSIYQ